MCRVRREEGAVVLPTAPRETTASTGIANPVGCREDRVANEHQRAEPPARDASTDVVHRAADRISRVVTDSSAHKASSVAMDHVSAQGVGKIPIAPGTETTDVSMACARLAEGETNPAVPTAAATTGTISAYVTGAVHDAGNWVYRAAKDGCAISPTRRVITGCLETSGARIAASRVAVGCNRVAKGGAART